MIVGKILATGGKFFSTAAVGLAVGAAGFVALHAGKQGDCCSMKTSGPANNLGHGMSCCTTSDNRASDGGQVALVQSKENADSKASEADGYVCPLTGEKLACPNCCPLNKKE